MFTLEKNGLEFRSLITINKIIESDWCLAHPVFHQIGLNFPFNRLDYQPLFREMSPRSPPEKTTGLVNETLLISINKKLACLDRAGGTRTRESGGNRAKKVSNRQCPIPKTKVRMTKRACQACGLLVFFM